MTKLAIPPTVIENQHIILFDGVCNLCSGFMRFIYKYDTKSIFKFAWIQDEKGIEILTWLNLPTDNYNTIILIERGTAYYKSEAFLRIVRQLAFPWQILMVGKLFPNVIRNWIYDIVAKNRYNLFGKKDHCLIPTGNLVKRFL
jgi:predicted DCC family thiol-disulfide oxidoreductase YuxK